MMKKLIVDVGNSYTKIYVFEKENIIYAERIENNLVDFNNVLEQFTIDYSLISNVSNDFITDTLKSGFKNVVEFSYKLKLPIKINYKTPETLGKDRIAGAIGASHLFKGENIMVIDAGTAITYDFINRKGEFLGGNISPGLKIRFKALHTFTEKLPLLKPNNNFEPIANSTDEAIISGVQQGIIFELDSYINHFKGEFEDLKIILTGGDSFFFEKKIKNNIFAEPNLIAYGLNRTLELNV